LGGRLAVKPGLRLSTTPFLEIAWQIADRQQRGKSAQIFRLEEIDKFLIRRGVSPS